MDEQDTRLITEIIEGSEDAFSDLFEKYRLLVYCQAYRLVMNEEDALDIVQDTFIKIISVIEQKGLEIKNLPAFLRRMALNQALDFLRTRKRKAILHRIMFKESGGGIERSHPGEEVARGELHAELMRVVMKLSPLQQRVICLRHFEDLRIADIAEVCGCSTGAVKQHLHRAYKKLRKLINRDAFGEFLQPGVNWELNNVGQWKKEWD